MEKTFILIFICHFIFFAEGSCDNFKTGVVLLIAPMTIVNYFRKNVFKISWPEFSAHSFASNWQLLFLNQRKRENSCRMFFMNKSPRKNVPDVGIELGAACMQSGHASDRATAPGDRQSGIIKKTWEETNYRQFSLCLSISVGKTAIFSERIRKFKEQNWRVKRKEMFSLCLTVYLHKIPWQILKTGFNL